MYRWNKRFSTFHETSPLYDMGFSVFSTFYSKNVEKSESIDQSMLKRSPFLKRVVNIPLLEVAAGDA